MGMALADIKEKLHRYIDSAEERKLQAIYIMLEEEIEFDEEYSDEFKNELDSRLADYKDNGVVISETDANERISNLLRKLKPE
jgi:hypothetical protein